MRQVRIWAAVLAIIMILSMAACSGNKEEGNGETTAVSAADQQKVIEDLAKAAEEVPVPEAEATVSADAAAGTSSNEVSSAEKLLGDWADINDATRIVKITGNGDQYEYEDADGKYPGTFYDGVLTIHITEAENDTAKVFIDSKTGNMVTDYQGDIYEFSRKLE